MTVYTSGAHIKVRTSGVQGVPGPQGVPGQRGPAGPIDTSYTDAQIAWLRRRPMSMDKVAELAFGLPGAELFPGSSRAGQGLDVARVGGVKTLFAFQRVAGSTGLTTERHAIAAMPFPTTDAPIVPPVITAPLALGHQCLTHLPERTDGKFFLVGQFAHVPGHEGTDTGKGICTIEWKGAATSQADVKNYQLFGFTGSGHRFADYHSATPAISPDGKWLVLVAQDIQSDDAGGPDGIQDVVNHLFFYAMAKVLAAADPLTVDPEYLVQINPPDRGERVQYTQGVVCDGGGVWVQRGYTAPRLRHVLMRYDMAGNLLAEYDIDDVRALYTVDQLMGSSGAIMVSGEPEGLALDEDGSLLWYGMDDWRQVGSVMSLEGRAMACIVAPTEDQPPDDELYWTPTILPSSGEWVAGGSHAPGTWVRKGKVIVRIRFDALGAYPLAAGKTLRTSGASLSSRSNAVDASFDLGTDFVVAAFPEILQKYFRAFAFMARRHFRVWDIRVKAARDKFISISANFLDGREIFEQRVSGTVEAGAAANYYGGGDPFNPHQVWFGAGGVWHVKVRPDAMLVDYPLMVARTAISTGNAPVEPQDGFSVAWVEGIQDLGAGEGIGFGYGVQLIGDLAPVMVARSEIVKVDSNDSSRVSRWRVMLSPTGSDTDRREVVGADPVTGRAAFPFGTDVIEVPAGSPGSPGLRVGNASTGLSRGAAPYPKLSLSLDGIEQGYLTKGGRLGLRGTPMVKANIARRNRLAGRPWSTAVPALDNSWRVVCWAPELGLFCALASTGTGTRVMTSPDGVTWMTRTSASDNEWYGLCWSPELRLFAATAITGTGNRVMTSPDGVTWTARTTPADNNWDGICWSGELGLFCAIAITGTGNRVMTSPDGVAWTLQATPVDNNWRGICWSPELGLFCAVASSGTNRVMTSPDGMTWTTRTTSAANQWWSVCWAAEVGLFCAVAITGTGNQVMTSPDGITWTPRASAADNNWWGVCWAPEIGLFCAVADVGTDSRVMTSPDGITWTLRTSAADNSWRAICWSGELGVFCAVAITGTGNRVMTSQSSRGLFARNVSTIAALPANAPPGSSIWCSDLGGGGGQLNSDGTRWRRVSRGGRQTVTSDADFTLTPLVSAEEQRHTGTLTANRTITLSATNAYDGARFRVTRTGAGAFTLDIGGLKSLATGTWAEVTHDGTAWYLSAYGAL